MERKFYDLSGAYRRASERLASPAWQSAQRNDFCAKIPGAISDDTLAMVFANMQPLDDVYSFEEALREGTLFPNLNKPFKGGRC